MRRYDWDAADYERHSTAQRQWALELIAKLDLRGDEDVLDVGCGDGKVTAEIAGRLPGGSVVGIDNSEAMISLAQSRRPVADHPNLSFVLGDARSLPFRDGFGVVFSNAVLHWVRDHRPVLAGVFLSARPGARVVLQMGGKGNAAGGADREGHDLCRPRRPRGVVPHDVAPLHAARAGGEKGGIRGRRA